MKYLGNFFIGVVTVNVLAIIYMFLGGCIQVCSICGSCSCAESPLGAVMGFAFVFLASVVTTMGIALIVWVPGLILIGSLTRSLFKFVRGLFSPKKNSTEVLSTPSNKETAIVNYIKNSRTKGIDDTLIRSNLTSSGWAEGDIDQAFKNSSNE